jgi:hypothetical protein
MKILAVVLLVIALLVFSAAAAVACSCALKTPTEQLNESDVVVVASVFSTELVEPPDAMPVSRSLVIVESYWKGLPDNSFVVQSTMFSSCAFSLSPGIKYLIYANASAENSLFATHMCMRTRPVAQAQDDLDELGPPQAVQLPVQTATWGYVKTRYR